MKIRLFYPYFPFPFHEAAALLMFHQACDLVRAGHQVEVVTWKDDRSQLARKREAASRFFWPPEIKIIAWPTAEGGPFARPLRLASALVGEDTSPELHYYPPEADRRHELDPADLEIYHYTFAHSWLRRSRSTARKTVVHFHNLEHELYELRARSENVLAATYHRSTASRLRKHELQLPTQIDESWHVALPDLENHKKMVGESATMRFVPPTLSPTNFERRWSTPVNGRTSYRLGFIGGLDFEPNRRSFLWILDELSARIAARPELKIEILQAGKTDESTLRAAQRYPFVRMLGFVEDIESWWSELDWTMVPDLTSAGVRVKLLESLASKVPVLATPKAASRLAAGLQMGPGLFVSESAEAWLSEVLRQQPGEARRALRNQDFPADLTGEKTYQFLSL